MKTRTPRRQGVPADVHAPVRGSSADGRPARYGADLAAIANPRGGRPLPDSVRARMEQAFQTDFAAVRLHNGPEATALDALAATQGSHIFLPQGDYDLNSRRGTERLAHELAHVRQQMQGRTRAAGSGLLVDPNPALEREAQAAGRAVALGMPARREASPGWRALAQTDGRMEAAPAHPSPQPLGDGSSGTGGAVVVQRYWEINRASSMARWVAPPAKPDHPPPPDFKEVTGNTMEIEDAGAKWERAQASDFPSNTEKVVNPLTFAVFGKPALNWRQTQLVPAPGQPGMLMLGKIDGNTAEAEKGIAGRIPLVGGNRKQNIFSQSQLVPIPGSNSAPMLGTSMNYGKHGRESLNKVLFKENYPDKKSRKNADGKADKNADDNARKKIGERINDKIVSKEKKRLEKLGASEKSIGELLSGKYRMKQMKWTKKAGGTGYDEMFSTASTKKVVDEAIRKKVGYAELINLISKLSTARELVTNLIWTTKDDASRIGGHPGAISSKFGDMRHGVTTEHFEKDAMRAAWAMKQYEANEGADSAIAMAMIMTNQLMSQPFAQLSTVSSKDIGEAYHARHDDLRNKARWHYAKADVHNSREIRKVIAATWLMNTGYQALVAPEMQMEIGPHSQWYDTVSAIASSNHGRSDDGPPRSRAFVPQKNDKPETLSEMIGKGRIAVSPPRRHIDKSVQVAQRPDKKIKLK